MARKRKSKSRTKTSSKKVAGGKLYKRAFGPLVDNFGKEIAPLGTDAGAIAVTVGRMLLNPLKKTVAGLPAIGDWLRAAIAARLKNVPNEKIVEPNPRIAVPAVQSLVYSMDDEYIKEMFATLIATDMNADTKRSAHPAFVEIIRQMTPQDAKLFLRLFHDPQIRYETSLVGGGKIWHPDVDFSFELPGMDRFAIEYSLENLLRLGLVELRDSFRADKDFSEKEQAIRRVPESMAKAFADRPEGLKSIGFTQPPSVRMVKKGIYAAGFGVGFWTACVQIRPQDIPSELRGS
jgi:hypothetical protein